MDTAIKDKLGRVSVIYQPESGVAVTIFGMFDEVYELIQPGLSAVEQIGPVVWLELEDLPCHPDEDDPLLTINGVRYKVRERQTDGAQGNSIRLLLHIHEEC